MAKSFLKAYSFQILLVVVPLLIFAVLFALFSLEWSIYFVAAILSLTFLLIYLINRYLYFTKEQEKIERIEELEQALVKERTNHKTYQKDIEAYFLLWVHQIKSPISASYLLLDNDEEGTKQLQYQELTKIENYTNMVLNYLKVMQPDTDMNFSHVTLDDLIRPLIKKYRVQFIQHHVTLKYEAILDVVLTDKKLTSIVIEQLLNNALKYAKGESIEISFESKANQLKIADTGIGIIQEELPRIFNKGYSGLSGQFDQKSSGIGLYLVKKISDRLDQQITVTSQRGVGTEFTIKFHEDGDFE